MAAIPEDRRVPFTVIGGYLGAGKTTLLNQLLRENDGMRLAVIVNDFGDIGIDADLIVGHEGDTINLTNGCICCTISDGLVNVLDDLHRRADHIDHVVVEASGVSDPVRIGHYAGPFGFELRGVIVLADAEQIRRQVGDKYVGDTVISQLCGADIVLLTKTDLVDGDQLIEVRRRLDDLVPGATVVDAPFGQLPKAVVLGEFEPTTQADDRPPVHAIGYDTWNVMASEPIERRSLDAFVDALPLGVLRVKGFVHLADDPEHRFVLQVVGRRATVVRGDPWNGEVPGTRLVVIGKPGTLAGARSDGMMLH
jgi:G3E family GTPase